MMSPRGKVGVSYGLTVLLVAAVTGWMGGVVVLEAGGVWRAPGLPVLLPGFLLAYSCCRMLLRILKQWHLTVKGLRLLRSNLHRELSKQLQEEYRVWNTEILVVQDKAFVGLNIGLWRPRIVVSTATLAQCSAEEVKGILLHELHHCRKRDNLRLFILTLMAESFFYLPVIKPVLAYVHTWLELFADRFAIRQMGTSLHVGTVLLKLAGGKRASIYGTALQFAGTALDYRMLQVISPEEEVQVPLKLQRPVLVTCCFLLLLMVGGSS
jgi:Zn-dependent protease with chaperone function